MDVVEVQGIGGPNQCIGCTAICDGRRTMCPKMFCFALFCAQNCGGRKSFQVVPKSGKSWEGPKLRARSSKADAWWAKPCTRMLVMSGARENVSLAYGITRQSALAYPCLLGLRACPAVDHGGGGGRLHLGRVAGVLQHRAARAARVPASSVYEAVGTGGRGRSGGGCLSTTACTPASTSTARVSTAAAAPAMSHVLQGCGISQCVVVVSGGWGG
jgi:hypothetical protein